MKLYYTGAPILNNPQENPNQSLGGFKSSTGVPNGRKNALFSDISFEDQNEGIREVRGIILKNETGNTVNNITAYFIPDYTEIIKFNLANTVSNPYFSISGALGEVVKLTIPSNTLDQPHLDLYNRVSEGKVGGGDFWTVDLFDGATTVNNIELDVKEAKIIGSNAVIEFEAPNYIALNLNHLTTVLLVSPAADYVFESLEKIYNEVIYELAAVTVNGGKIEKINDGKSLPFTGTFVEANGIANRVLLTNSILDNGEIGLWIKRTILPKSKIACEDLEEYQNKVPKIENLNLVIDFT